MIFAPRSDSEFALSEAGRGFDLVMGMMIDDGLRFVFVVVVGGRAVAIRDPEVHPTGVLAGTAAIGGHTAAPSPAFAGGGPVGVEERLVARAWIGVRAERPDLVD